MAKLNDWTTRHASALADDEEEDAYLRPATPAAPQRRARKTERVGRMPADPSEAAEAFLRTRRRVPPRKGSWLRVLLRTRAGRVLAAASVLILLAAAAVAFWEVRSFLRHDPHFRIEDSSDIQITGTTELSRDQLLKVFGSDIGRNIFYVPLAAREAVLEAQPWVAHAVVMRLLPDTLRVSITERAPVAFVRVGHEIELVDAGGVLLPMAPAALAAHHYSFPVVTGLDPNAAPAVRAGQMQLFARFVHELDAGGARNSAQLSEVDLSDVDDVRAVVPAQGTDILLHFGNGDFLNRWRSYQEHIAGWRQQYPNLSAVDLRYERQVVLKMADAAQADQAAEARPLPGAAPAAAAGARPAHIAVSHRAPAAHTPAHTTAHRTSKTAQQHHASKWKPHYIAHAGSGK